MRLAPDRFRSRRRDAGGQLRRMRDDHDLRPRRKRTSASASRKVRPGRPTPPTGRFRRRGPLECSTVPAVRCPPQIHHRRRRSPYGRMQLVREPIHPASAARLRIRRRTRRGSRWGKPLRFARTASIRTKAGRMVRGWFERWRLGGSSPVWRQLGGLPGPGPVLGRRLLRRRRSPKAATATRVIPSNRTRRSAVSAG
jgi:hypothetical protein